MNGQQTVITEAAETTRQTSTRAVAAACIGNVLEWYDFSLYAYFAIYFAGSFFNSADPGVQLVEAFLAFGLGYVIRPVGAVVLGSYGDRAGRKSVLMLTIMLMAGGTAIIALAPTYAVIGIGAPILIVIGRLLQGFSAGGELGGAAAFLVEHAPANKKGRYAAWLQASMGITNILSALVATCMTLIFDKAEISAWAWRIPFLLGLVILPIGLWLRRTLHETPEFEAEMKRQRLGNQERKIPVLQLLREYPKQLLMGTGMCILWVVSVYTLIIFMPTHMQRAFGFTGTEAFQAMFIGNIFLVVGCVLSGGLSDHVGRLRVLLITALLLGSCVLPLFQWLDESRSFVVLVLVEILLCSLVSFYSGVAPAALSEIFPTEVRTTGMALSYNLASGIFGSFAPAILTWIFNHTKSANGPAFYVIGASFFSLFAIGALYLYRDHHQAR
jgi:MHS family proline/betaine transporter-like MFS transporter